MNNLSDIYNNIFTNIEDIYIKRDNPKVIIQGYYRSVFDIDDNWKKFKNYFINILLNNTDDNCGMHIGYVYIDNENITYVDKEKKDVDKFDTRVFYDKNNNSREYIVIPVYIVFTTTNNKTNKDKDNINYTILNKDPNNNNIDTSKLAFVINIVTHHVSSFTNKFEILAHEYFYRQFDFKQFSVNIFDHIYQPSFRLITSKEEISNIHDKYLIDFSSMGSIFINDPVNKYMFGLPKFNIDGLKKDFPDVYAIHQDQGINYRKVIANGSHNPFKK